jgi:hypothetical protein
MTFDAMAVPQPVSPSGRMRSYGLVQRLGLMVGAVSRMQARLAEAVLGTLLPLDERPRRESR